MRWYAESSHPEFQYFIVRQDSKQAGFYLYGYCIEALFREDLRNPSGRCPNHQYDIMQDTLERTKLAAFDSFNVPLDAWKQVE